MEVLKPSKLNQLNNFIEGWYINPKMCDNLITYFENSPDKEKGGSLNSKTNKIEYSSRKISTDLGIYHKHNKNSQEVRDYCDELFKVLEKYKKKYKYCDINQEAWDIAVPFNIQKYKPHEGFLDFHCERNTGHGGGSLRHLVFMTYLNDVTDGGETEFFYQKLKVKPEKGLTLIWGADWTFTHKGVTSPTQTKYITTGWFNYK